MTTGTFRLGGILSVPRSNPSSLLVNGNNIKPTTKAELTRIVFDSFFYLIPNLLGQSFKKSISIALGPTTCLVNNSSSKSSSLNEWMNLDHKK